jgi:hypothetical protein
MLVPERVLAGWVGLLGDKLLELNFFIKSTSIKLKLAKKISTLVVYSQDFIFSMKLAFNLSNGLTDTLESNSILIYFEAHMDLYTQKVARCHID